MELLYCTFYTILFSVRRLCSTEEWPDLVGTQYVCFHAWFAINLGPGLVVQYLLYCTLQYSHKNGVFG